MSYGKIGKILNIICFIFSVFISGDSSSYSIEMNMYISLEGTLTKTSVRGHEGLIYFSYSKIPILYIL